MLPSDRRSLLNGMFAKLDISQVIGHLHLDDEWKEMKSSNEETFLSAETPWANILAYAFKLVKLGVVESWTEEDLKDLGRFAIILSPDQIGRISTVAFSQSAVDAILSARLTLGQLTAIYKKIEDAGIQLKNDLYSAIPSSVIASPNSPFTWTMDQVELLKSVSRMSPGQKQATLDVLKPGIWSFRNITAILLHQPSCLSSVPTKIFRQNIDIIVDSIYGLGNSGFSTAAEKIRKLPRHLRMAWLERVHDEPGSTSIGSLWNTDVLLDRPTVSSRANISVTNPFGRFAPLSLQFERFTSANKSLLPSLSVGGMSCHCINLVETQNTVEVLGMYR